jgi:hypothetical protein
MAWLGESDLWCELGHSAPFALTVRSSSKVLAARARAASVVRLYSSATREVLDTEPLLN